MSHMRTGIRTRSLFGAAMTYEYKLQHRNYILKPVITIQFRIEPKFTNVYVCIEAEMFVSKLKMRSFDAFGAVTSPNASVTPQSR